MFEIQMTKTWEIGGIGTPVSSIWILGLEFVSDFEIRISNLSFAGRCLPALEPFLKSPALPLVKTFSSRSGIWSVQTFENIRSLVPSP